MKPGNDLINAAGWEKMPYPAKKGKIPLLDKKTAPVRLQINADKLRYLLDTGALCAADFCCLDCQSKQCVQRICLMNCLKHFNHDSST
jgi:hypothetical protein